MLVLGLASFGRNTAAALLDSDSILFAVEEEKLTRLQEAADLPQLAIARALQQASAKSSDLDVIALADRPPAPGASHAKRRLAATNAALGRLKPLLHGGPRITRFDHHLCHAASAYYTSGFDRSLILSLDHGSASRSGLAALGEDDDIRILDTLPFPNSLGWFYSQITELVGLRARRDEHKLQWHSKDGEPAFLDEFRKLFSFNSRGALQLNRRYFDPGPDKRGTFSAKFFRELGIPRRGSSEMSSSAASVARSAQDLLEELVLQWAESLRQQTKADSICLAGGVFLNSLLVRALETRSGFRNVYVQPVAGNAGTALGAAFLARKKRTGNSRRSSWNTLALGPDANSQEIKAVLDNCKIVYRYLSGEEQSQDEVCRLLEHGKIVAWCQGRTEFGHRALGNRSLLASPFNEYVVDNVNQFIKHREDFHPFALSVPAERAAEFFDCTPNCRFMASLGTLKNPVAGLERFAFNGNAVRVHTVERQANPGFWKLLHRFGERAPAPVLVNTSFNLFGEPLVTDPRAAVRSFYCSGVDALALGPFFVIK